MKRELLLAQFAATPWALAPEYLAEYSAVLKRWAAGTPAAPGVMAEIEAAQAARIAKQKASSAVGGGIAVLSLTGVISQRASMIDDISDGGTSTERFSKAFRDALGDSSVSGIIIDMDSPGGSVFGVAELWTEIMNARGTKPVMGFINSLSASACYWIASACDSLYITQGGQVGSIGVYMQHVDASAAMEMEGLKAQFISAGKYKVEGNPYGPLDPDARGFMQSQIDSYYASFTSAIAKGRGVPVSQVRDGMGQGRCLMASAAVSEKMVDGVDTFEGVVSRMSKAIRANGSMKAEVTDEPIQAAVVVPVEDPTPIPDQVASTAHRAAARRREIEIRGL